MEYFIRIKKQITILLILSLLLLILIPGTIKAEKPVNCEKALEKCMIDAGITGAFGGLYAGLAYTAFCGVGYAFCKEFL
ncbi:hypothetical protein J7K93_14035 [bacterium]|nr:hypothetical protein [bacterium]